MEAKNGSTGFDFTGKYSKVEQHRQIEYTIDDGRNVQVLFVPEGNVTRVMEAFEAEQTNPKKCSRQAGRLFWITSKNMLKCRWHRIMHFEITINANAEKVYQAMLDNEKYKNGQQNLIRHHIS